ncbi:cyclic nucleotide-binding domain-containing protein [bacterium]|nr:MAG: cyclic nucleotide-binding domain-containing protein [bacterium]
MSAASDFRLLPIFQAFTDQQFERICSILDYRQLSSGETIFRQGDAAAYLYILLKGKVAIRYKPYDGPPLNISTILPGWIFGWSAALEKTSYSSSAIALEESAAFSISKEYLQKICKINCDTGIIFMEMITNCITERLESVDREIFTDTAI